MPNNNRPTSALQPVSYDSSHSGEPRLLIDRQSRISLNAAARALVDLTEFTAPMRLYVSYDADGNRVGIAKPDIVKLTDVKPHKFDKRGYASAKALVNRFRLDVSQSMEFTYAGREHAAGTGHWHTFKFSRVIERDSQD